MFILFLSILFPALSQFLCTVFLMYPAGVQNYLAIPEGHRKEADNTITNIQ